MAFKSADLGYKFFVKSSPQRTKRETHLFNLPLKAVFTETARDDEISRILKLTCDDTQTALFHKKPKFLKHFVKISV